MDDGTKPLIWDNRVDKEKLNLLLQCAESQELEFKRELDLSHKKDELNFVKDAIAMVNNPLGAGYFLIGVNDDGTINTEPWLDDPTQFDAARIADKIDKYVDANIQVVTKIHDVDNHPVIIISLQKDSLALPIPMGKHGGLPDSNNYAFRKGDLFVRISARNEPFAYKHWRLLLDRHDKEIRRTERQNAQELFRSYLANESSQQNSPYEQIPLTTNVDNDLFLQILRAVLTDKNDNSITEFFSTIKEHILEGDAATDALNKLTMVGCQALRFGRTDLALSAVDELHLTFQKTIDERTDLVREIIVRLYILGATAVRYRRWSALPRIVLRRQPSPEVPDYVYSSWIRCGQVQAARAGHTETSHSGYLVSRARAVALQETGLRPGLEDFPDHTNERQGAGDGTGAVGVRNGGDISPHETLLNSICHFDFLYALIVNVAGEGEAGAFPSSAGFASSRVQEIVDVLCRQSYMRRQIFPGVQDADIALGLQQTRLDYNKVGNERRFRDPLLYPFAAAEYLQANLPEDAA
ncbi:MAG TPA: ATP-binding protein [Corynebacteriales bacterium]|nr:ATP-binding protein [Mycobacteriales bacterium]